ncbi:MAG: hypothetical protein A4S09_08105 [Proteobacteria bacterium SG_bin7]|nr:MAG: hypothetical protein A4S09_08105 [Proteobacteria bacterium SG_bin7]
MIFLILVAIVIVVFVKRDRNMPPPIESPEVEESEEAILEAPAPMVVQGTGSAPVETSNQAEIKLGILQDILNSGKDNDPRLESELKVLDSATKQAFTSLYDEWAPEGRNGRGTIIFLIGRNLNEKSDFDFLGRVLGEPQCLSLIDCNVAPEPGIDEDQGATEIALMYPQVVALESIRRVFETDPATFEKFRAEIELALAAGSKSDSPLIAERSEELLRTLSQ